ncbi:MAG: GspH/FimT family pseudopilin [Candidatus Methylomirabilales bacterium]
MAGDNKGISIIEILMVALALAVMAGMAMPSVSRTLEVYRLRGAAWNLAGDLRLARQKAVSLQLDHRICLTDCSDAVPAGGYLLERQNPGGPPPGWVVDVFRSDVPDGVTITTTALGGKLTFDTKGGVSGAMGTMTLTNGSGTYQVATAITGRVLVCKGNCP